MSPARRRRAHRQRIVRFGADNWKGLGGVIALAVSTWASMHHADEGAGRAQAVATSAYDRAGAVASVSVSTAQFEDSLAARITELEYRLARVERRKGRPVTYIDTIHVSTVPYGPAPQPKNPVLRFLGRLNPFGGKDAR